MTKQRAKIYIYVSGMENVKKKNNKITNKNQGERAIEVFEWNPECTVLPIMCGVCVFCMHENIRLDV